MVPGPVLVHLPELPLQLSESETLVVGAALPAPPEPGLQIGVDEQLQGAVLRQDQVRVAAHNDAVPVGGQGPEDAALLLKQLPGVMGHGGEIGKGATDGQWDAAKVALLQRILPLRPLRDCGFTEADFKAFPLSVEANQQRLMTNAYYPFDLESEEAIYRKCY